MESLQPLSPAELARRRAGGESFVLLDVREPFEWEIGHLQGALHVPLGELTRRVGELDPAAPTVCICHHGQRSARAAAWLASQGFERVYNLSGGVERWSLEVDPNMPRY
jgi:rhodanese-related sulfurtransferase